MKLGIIGYVPPPTRGHPAAFIKNVDSFGPGVGLPLVWFSDYDWKLPGLIRIGSVDRYRDLKSDQGKPNRFVIPNLVFFTAVRIARAQGFSHFMFLEDDCRVGCNHWATRMFDEAFSHPGPWIEAGSMAGYNICNAGLRAAIRWEQAVVANAGRGHPIPTYGWKGAAEQHPSCVFVNGALGIYSVDWIWRLFNCEDTVNTARLNTAYDMAIGIAIWAKFADRAYDLVQHTKAAFSSYGNIMSTEDERMDMLRSGKVVAVHQIKGDPEL